MVVAAPLLSAFPRPVSGQEREAADTALVRLVRNFVEAQGRFDQERLAELTTDDYVEVSPAGEVDRRDAFLGFYTADRKGSAPAMQVSEPLIRRHGDTASIIVRLSFERPGAEGQPARRAAIRAGYLAVRSGGAWKLALAQYTPERPKAAAAATN